MGQLKLRLYKNNFADKTKAKETMKNNPFLLIFTPSIHSKYCKLFSFEIEQ